MLTGGRRFAHIVLLTTALLLSAFLFVYYYYQSAGPLAEPKTVMFKKGMGFEAIVDHMADEDVIRLPLLFKAIAVIVGDARKFKAGEYEFSAAISPKLVMDMIAEGRVVVHKITIPEGLTVNQAVELLNGQSLLEGNVVGSIKEGSLLPQTYHYTYGDTRQQLILRMQAAMDSTLDELWATHADDLPVKSREEAVVLASIVEKETGIAEERGRVAAVFVNRLKKGMKLQSDPTVIYALEKENGKLDHPLTRADLALDSPYNTYKYEGLPPAPIANPGRDALAAVLNPPKTNDLYFVATGNGGHNFSETLKQHNANVQSYHTQLKAKKAK